MSLSYEDKASIKLAMKAFNTCSSEIEIILGKSKNQNRLLSKYSLIYCCYIDGISKLKSFAKELEISHIYKGKQIEMIFPELTIKEIKYNNTFLAIETIGYRRRAVIFWRTA